MINNKIKTILVPLDFSETSLNALETAISMAKQYKAAVLLLNVIDTSFIFGFAEVSYIAQKAIDNMIDASVERLNSIRATIKEKHQIACTSVLKKGIIASSIVKAASENEVDLIIMGTHGTSGFREFFIGSNAYKVVKISCCPVITVPPNKKWIDFKTILFLIRPIAGAVEKYDFLRNIIRNKHASIKILILTPTYDDLEKKSLEKSVKILKGKLDGDEIKVSGSLKEGGNMPEAVLQMSKSINADMIVITVATDSIFKKFCIKSFEQHIINHATVPVLSIRSELVSRDSQLHIEQMSES